MGGLQSVLPSLDGQRLYFKGLRSILLAVLCCCRHQIKQSASHLAMLTRRRARGVSGGAWRTILAPGSGQSVQAKGLGERTPKSTSSLPSACEKMEGGGIEVRWAPSCTGLMLVHLRTAKATLTREGTVSSGRGTEKVRRPGFLGLVCGSLVY